MISVAAMWLTYFLPTFQTQLAAPWYLVSCSFVRTNLEGTAARAGMAGIAPECIVRVLAAAA